MWPLRSIILLAVALGLVIGSAKHSTASPPEVELVLPTPTFTAVDISSPLFCNIPLNETTAVGCHANMLRDYLPAFNNSAVFNAPCTDNLSNGIYPCQDIHLQSNLPMSALGGGEGNDIWGWADPQNGNEYVIMGRTNGTAFVDITDPLNPVYLGNLPTHSIASIWRDIKVFQNHAYIVADNAEAHGMQIFDLTQLRTVTSPPVTFSETAHYDQFGSAHNIFINEDTGYAYVVRVSTGIVTCSGGLHMINIQNPTSPSFAGCYSNGTLTHDTQCILYNGPDIDYKGQEICISANEVEINIVDVTNKSSPVNIQSADYPSVSYAHQGWLTADHTYYLLNDELDESAANQLARTYIWDLSDLDNPELINTYTAVAPAIDHNLYIHEGLVFQSNYRSGLRVLTFSEIENGVLSEIGYFDTFPTQESNEVQYNGAWSNYPFFESKNVAVSTIEHGLFILRLDDSLYENINNPPNFSNFVYLPITKK